MVLEYEDGIVMDAIGVSKFHEMGDPDDPFYPHDGWDGMPGIRIERKEGKEVKLLFNTSEERNNVYNDLINQIRKSIATK